jgi:hypothetical protein
MVPLKMKASKKGSPQEFLASSKSSGLKRKIEESEPHKNGKDETACECCSFV